MANPPSALLPSPQKLTLSGPAWARPETLRIAVPTGMEALATRFGERLGVTIETTTNGSANVTLVTEPHPKPEGYTLKVDAEGVKITARDATGLRHGLTTLAHLCREYGDSIPGLEIDDWADLPERGYMLDISRCKVPQMDMLKEIVDLLCDLKYNQFQLYTEHTFAFEGHEMVWGMSSPVTASEIRELDEYCAERGIELVPNFNSFGHWERWLKHPEYRHLAECPFGWMTPHGYGLPWGSTLAPDEQSLKMLEGLFAELLPNFSSKRFNIGGDEPWELGMGKSRDRIETEGKQKIYVDFMKDIFDRVRANGKAPMFWADIVLEDPSCVPDLPDDALALIWGYGADHPFDKDCPRFAESQRPFAVCPGTSAWKTLTGRINNCLDNIDNATDNGVKHGASGLLLTDWGDSGHHQFPYVSLPGLMYAAARTWNTSADQREPLVPFLNTNVFQDATGKTGEVVFKLGRLGNYFGAKSRNDTPLFRFLITPQERYHEFLGEYTAEEVEAFTQGCEGIASDIEASDPQCADACLLKKELRTAIGLQRHIGARLKAFLERDDSQWPRLRRELSGLIGAYEDCWVARNRVGGLHESSEYLRNTLRSYPSQPPKPHPAPTPL